MTPTRIAEAKRLVIKVGSALVTNNGAGLDLPAIDEWAKQIAALRAQGREVVLVSSGAIACGMQRLGCRAGGHALQLSELGQVCPADVFLRGVGREAQHRVVACHAEDPMVCLMTDATAIMMTLARVWPG